MSSIPLLDVPFYYYFFIYAWVFQVVSFPQVSPPKPCMQLSCTPYVLHALPISVFLAWSPEEYLVKSREHKAFCYVVYSTSQSPRPSSAYFRKLGLKFFLNARHQVSHPYKKQTKLYFCISESLRFWILNFFYRYEWSAAHQRQLLRLQGTACCLNRVLQAHCNFRLFYSSFEAKNGIIPSRVSLDNRIVRWKADVVRRSQPWYPIPTTLRVCG